ncbi:hypothetical protein ACROYT_G021742 [Oculina patagonica]
MIAANTALAAQLAEEIIILTAKIVEHANPLKYVGELNIEMESEEKKNEFGYRGNTFNELGLQKTL